MRKQPITGEVWKHFKGIVYRIICISKDTETLKENVVYMEEERYKMGCWSDGEIWSRDMTMFMNKTDNGEWRFERC